MNYISEKFEFSNNQKSIMKRLRFALLTGIVLISFCYSCNHKGNQKNEAGAGNMVSQQKDGSILLKLEEAACYSDQLNPTSNTAEWTFVVPTPGRYKVWLSSATRDTTNLSYSTPVKISFLDNHLEASPACDKIVRDSDEVNLPYFRTDSYMGTFYIPEAGKYTIQVISEKVTTKEIRDQSQLLAENTKLMSLMLVPMTR